MLFWRISTAVWALSILCCSIATIAKTKAEPKNIRFGSLPSRDTQKSCSTFLLDVNDFRVCPSYLVSLCTKSEKQLRGALGKLFIIKSEERIPPAMIEENTLHSVMAVLFYIKWVISIFIWFVMSFQWTIFLINEKYDIIIKDYPHLPTHISSFNGLLSFIVLLIHAIQHYGEQIRV